MLYTVDDVRDLLDSLRDTPENEVVEYKEAKSSFPFKDLGNTSRPSVMRRS